MVSVVTLSWQDKCMLKVAPDFFLLCTAGNWLKGALVEAVCYGRDQCTLQCLIPEASPELSVLNCSQSPWVWWRLDETLSKAPDAQMSSSGNLSPFLSSCHLASGAGRLQSILQGEKCVLCVL